jgi:hypothetical protein
LGGLIELVEVVVRGYIRFAVFCGKFCGVNLIGLKGDGGPGNEKIKI